MTYKKLFGIEFNNKKLMIFIDENKRRTFLQMNEKGEYEYCLLEDFLVLSKMFNSNNPYIVCDIPNFNFKECVKLVKNGIVTVLAVVVVMNSSVEALAANIDYEVSDDKVAISYSAPPMAPNGVDITDAQELLNSYLGEIDLTEDLIIEAIDSNQNISDDFKKIIKENFKKHYQEHPKANYRIFYENIKRLTINIFTDEEYCKNNPSMAETTAHFDFPKHAINLRENFSKGTFLHELGHVYQFIYLEIGNSYIMVNNSNSRALTEGMTEIMQSRPKFGLYKTFKKVCEFLISISDFTFEEYTNKGIGYLITKCKKVYPDIDFDYISDCLDAMLDANVIIEEPVLMYDELFKVALKEVDVKAGYDPFIKFLDCLVGVSDESIAKDYFEKYTKELEKIGYFKTPQGEKVRSNIQKYGEIYEKANYIIYSHDHEFDTSLGIVGEDRTVQQINEDGTLTNISTITYVCKISHILKIKAAISGPNLRETIVDYLKDYVYISPNMYSSIPLYVNGKLLTSTITGDLSLQVGFTKKGEVGFIISDKDGKIIYKTKEELGNLSNKVALNHYLSLYDYYVQELELNNILNEDYLKKYQAECIGFCNFDVREDKIIIEPSTIISISGIDNGRPICQNYKLADCKIYVRGDYIFVGKTNYEHSEPVDYVIDIRSVLKFANLLVDGTPCYSISMDELICHTKSYLVSLYGKENVTKSGIESFSYSTETIYRT